MKILFENDDEDAFFEIILTNEDIKDLRYGHCLSKNNLSRANMNKKLNFLVRIANHDAEDEKEEREPIDYNLSPHEKFEYILTMEEK